MGTHLDLVKDWQRRVWMESDQSAIDEYFLPNGEAHGLGANTLVGPADFKAFHNAILALLRDFTVTVDHSIESGEWISAILTYRATSRRSGNPVVTTAAIHVRIRDNKVVEAYNHVNFIDLFMQMEALPQNTYQLLFTGQNIATTDVQGLPA